MDRAERASTLDRVLVVGSTALARDSAERLRGRLRPDVVEAIDSFGEALPGLETGSIDALFLDAADLASPDFPLFGAHGTAVPIVALVDVEGRVLEALANGADEAVVAADASDDALCDAALRARARARARGSAGAGSIAPTIMRAIDAATVLVLITDRDGRIRYANRHWSEVTGYSFEEAVGENPRLLKSGKMAPEDYQWLWNTIQEGKVWSGRLVNRRKNGDEFVEQKTITPVHGPDGSVDQYISIGADVTSIVGAQDRIAAAQKMEAIGRLTAGIGHDFNNLLGVVLAHAGLLVGSLPLDSLGPEVAEGLDQIREAAESGRNLVAALLAYGRRSRIHPRPLVLGTAVAELVEVIRRVLRDDVVVDFQAEQELLRSSVDQAMLQQVLLHLVVNAEDAMPEGGKVRVSVGSMTSDDHAAAKGAGVAPDRYAVIRVTDDGKGMDAQTLKRIYDPFFTTKSADKGTGLGLAMAYGVMRQHRGFIHTESTEGVGTTIRLFFPLVDEPPVAPAPEAEQSTPMTASPAAGSGEATMAVEKAAASTVLYVEDNAALRRAGRRVLESGGFQVLEAEHGVQAVELFERHGDEISFVLSDLLMPEMGGAALYRELSKRRPGLKFIVTSGHVDAALDQRDHLPDDIPYILKPWEPSQLLQLIRRILSGGHPGSGRDGASG